MRSKHGRRIVVDTSVARAATPNDSPDPRGRICRDVLEAVRDYGHKIVLTPAIIEEWNRHRSRYTRTWLTSMYARKLVEAIRPDENASLRRAVERFALPGREENGISRDREAMLKDVHLLEAALNTDRTIIALDETVRELFVALSNDVAEVRIIVWANPERDPSVGVWIEQGALPERDRMLGEQG